MPKKKSNTFFCLNNSTCVSQAPTISSSLSSTFGKRVKKIIKAIKRQITVKRKYIDTHGSCCGVSDAMILIRNPSFSCWLANPRTRYEYTNGLKNEAAPKTSWATTELKAKCSSPPAV